MVLQHYSLGFSSKTGLMNQLAFSHVSAIAFPVTSCYTWQLCPEPQLHWFLTCSSTADLTVSYSSGRNLKRQVCPVRISLCQLIIAIPRAQCNATFPNRATRYSMPFPKFFWTSTESVTKVLFQSTNTASDLFIFPKVCFAETVVSSFHEVLHFWVHPHYNYRSSEQPGLVEDVPAYGRGVGTRWSLRSLPTLIILWSCR